MCLAAVTLSTADQALFSYAIPSIIEEFSIDLDVIGQILSLSFLVASFAIVVVGLVADFWGRKRVFVATLALSATFVGLHGLADSLGWLTVFRALGFAVAAGLYPVTNTLLIEVAPARYRGMVGWLQIGYPIGFFVASLVAAPLIGAYGWRAVFLPAFLVIPLAFVLGRLLKETNRFKQIRAEPGEAKKRHSIGQHFGELLSKQLWRRTVGCFVGSFLVSLALGVTTYFIPTYFVQDRGLPEDTAALLVGSSYAIGVLGYLLAGYVGEFVTTRRNALIMWIWLGGLAFFCTLWFTATPLWLTLGYACSVMFLFGSEAIRMPMISELFPTRIRATATVMCGSLAVTTAWLIAPLALTSAVGRVGWSMAFTLFAVVPLALGGAAFLMLQNVASGLEVEEISQ